jgi:putative nucleotidyltransferase with HDIG domain
MSSALTIDAVERRIGTLPSLPSVVAEVMRLDPNSPDAQRALWELASRDPPFAVRLVAVANGATSAPVSPIGTLREAVLRLGSRQVLLLLTSLAVARVFVPRTPGQRALWTHAIQTAVAARVVAPRIAPSVDPQWAYLVGLLHDVGRFVMFEHDVDALETVERSGWRSPSELVAAERAACHFDHAELGWRACRAWGLPDAVGTPVRLHHAAQFEEDVGADVVCAVKCVQAADAFSCLLMSDPECARLPPESLRDRVAEALAPTVAGAFGPAVATLSVVARYVSEESARLTAALGLGAAPIPA